MELDELFSIRNLFWVGNYDQALEEADRTPVNGERQKIDKEIFIMRSHIGMRDYATVLQKVPSSSPTALLAVKMLASYLSQPAQREAIMGTVQDWLADESTGSNPTLRLMAATIFYHAGDIKETLRILENPVNLEMHALKVQVYISISRNDLAKNEVMRMQQIDEDATLSQMATAWTYLAEGSEKAQEALYIFQEQIDKTMSSALLMNSIALCHLKLQNFSDAERYLEDALAKEPNNPDIMINLLSCYANTRKGSEKTAELLATLNKIAPNHTMLTHLNGCMKSYNESLAQFRK